MTDEFGGGRENAQLAEEIRGRIREAGRITFREFMEAALYHPRLGYYRAARPPMGRQGDYVTSPETGSLFGAMVGRQLREMWESLGAPAAFDVVEAGPGNGLLARDMLEWAARAAAPFFDAIRYDLVETSGSLAEQQRRTLGDLELPAGKVAWSESLPDAVDGCVVSNELLDAFPVHRVLVRGGRLNEVYVTLEDGAFSEEIDEPSTPEIEAYFGRLGLLPGEGCYAEVNLEAPRWMASAGAALRRGFILTFDYGYEAPELYASWHRDGTLLCFYQQSPATDPYARIGRQDITASVDFTTLISAGEACGLTTLGLTTQARFLEALGLHEALQVRTGSEAAMEEYFARRRAALELTDAAGLGRIRVLVQSKNLGRPALTGLAGERTAG